MQSLELAREVVKLEQEVTALRVTDDIIAEWRQHPATKLLLMQLKQSQLKGMGEWASSEFQKETDLATMRANSEALGGMRLLESIISGIEEVQL